MDGINDFYDLPPDRSDDGTDNLVLRRILGHRRRQRESFRNGGWDDFDHRELLEVLLGYAVPRRNLSPLARELCKRFGGVMDVLLTPEEQLLAVPGMTPVMAEWLRLTGELVVAYQSSQRAPCVSLMSFADLRRYLEERRGWAVPPEGWMLYSDFEHSLICRQPMERGVPWWHFANLRRVVQHSTSLQARYAFIALFRGDGPARLSPAELRRLEDVANMFEGMNTALVDCVLVSRDEIYSMNVHGRFDFSRSLQRPGFFQEQYGGRL